MRFTLASLLALVGAVSSAILKEPRCINGEWTPFYDRDDPSGGYDYESLSAIQLDNPGEICPTPTAIDARLLSGAHYSMGGDTLQISPTLGLICKNADQKDKRCNDYKVRFCCPKYVEPVCENGEWTDYFDRDDPTGDYDYESLSDIQAENPGKICSKPIGVDARLLNGTLYQAAGENVAVSPSIGLICRNSDQADKRCQDYKVRFCCPKEPVFECPDNAWTPWFDRDNPSGTGDHEDLQSLHIKYPGKICPSPSAIDARLLNGAHYSTSNEVVTVSPSNGLVCLNSAQSNGKCSDYKVRFCCFGESTCRKEDWTQWFDRDNPSGDYDWEGLASIQQQYPGRVCTQPTAIDAQLTNGAPYTDGNDVLVIDPTYGLTCKNADQPDKKCNDYKVRFCCSKNNEVPTCNGNWTGWFDRDNPSGHGDFETLSSLIEANPGKICTQPSAIDARLTNGQQWQSANQVVSVSPSSGLTCRNSQNKEGCEDYKVRFCCQQEEPVCADGEWTDWYDRDNPGGYGDYETLSSLQQENPGKICDSPSAIDARLLNDQPWQAGGQAVSVSTTTGLACVNSQNTGGCKDYKVRFCCKPVTVPVEPVCEGGKWTAWYDRDNPGGVGDFETLVDLHKEHPDQICKEPAGIDARLVSSKLPWYTSGQVVSVSATSGLSCVNNANTGYCQDYEVRFCCKPPTPPDNPVCAGGEWTQWFDRDNPGGYGDYETLSTLQQENPGKICDSPSAIDARLLDDQPWQAGGQTVSVTTTGGLACVNSQNEGGCKDYKVRFCCKPAEPICAGGKWTQWFDRDNPSGYGDYETLSSLLEENPGQICDQPSAIDARLLNDAPWQSANQAVSVNPLTGLACVNSQNGGGCLDYKVRFCCKPVEPECPGGKWTGWYDRDNPGGYGDYETLSDLQSEHPGEICPQPAAIDAQLLDGRPWQAENQNVIVSPTYGLACVNSQNKGGCKDYKVRFCCKPVEPVCPGGAWTQWFNRDNPSGDYDWETLESISKQYPGKVCAAPSSIEAQLLNGSPYTAGGDIVQVSPSLGLICENAVQPDKRCNDYKVRFCCFGESTCRKEDWTQWFDRDNPGGYYDWEGLTSIQQQYPGKVCTQPTAIDAQLTNGAPISASNEVLVMNPTYGLTCKNADQPDKSCEDYRVRFCCPKRETPICPNNKWTPWFDRDNPSGYYDYESLSVLQRENPGKICASPSAIDAQLVKNGAPYQDGGDNVIISRDIGLICENRVQPDRSCNDYKVRFCCAEDDVPVCKEEDWTAWFDSQKPGRLNGLSDRESLADLRKLYPGRICNNPSAIDAQLSTGAPYTSGGDVLSVGPLVGLICNGRDQKDQACNNYRVRFCCEGEESGGQNIDVETKQLAMEAEIPVEVPQERELSLRTRA